MLYKNKKLALIRLSSSYLNIKKYNSQELGLAKELQKLGYQIDIFTTAPNYKLKIVSFSEQINIIYLQCIKLPGRNGFYPSLFRALRNTPYDIIQVSEDSQIMSVLITRWAKKNHIPCILFQGMYKNYQGFFKRSLQILYDLIFLPILRTNLTHSICKTKAAEIYLHKKNICNTDVIGVGINNEAFLESSSDWRSKLNISKEKKILLYVGIIEERRNPLLIVEIARSILRDDIIFIIVGNGPLYNLMKNQIISYCLQKKIVQIKSLPQSDLGGLYKVASILLLPSNYEIFGMVLLESMYHGVSCITSSNAGSKDIIINETLGIIVENLIAKDWILAIEKVLDMRKAIPKIPEILHTKFNETWNWEVLAKKYDSIYSIALSIEKPRRNENIIC